MKHILITLCFATVWITNAQNHAIAHVSTSEHIDLLKTKAKRTTAHHSNHYFYSIASVNSSKPVKQLQNKIIDFNIRTTHVFDNSEEATYDIRFKNSNGIALVTYNNEGILIASKEVYKNISTPLPIRKLISQAYPLWNIKSTLYTVRYNKHQPSAKCFTAVVTKGDLKKTISFNL
ncbi:hypothetical protein KFZ70_16155 [Tamlana fucoidanivorans]|uniref:Nicotinate-nucleotide adenylyltransferase n=1 Tax=Allotamlana fucoidanivorans TaxID=2583814 RepID=A0A5C4SH17_9FLAO|nr:hypothetical protein [Tamlana fucoidanivorans]TNJ42925.1 hypothetical protein FGF67_13120 [Tamlana fucoidanivorans]